MGKKVTGRKRLIFVDTLGLLLSVAVHSADIQRRDGAALVLDKRTRALFPFIERIFADAGYQGQELQTLLPPLAAPLLSGPASFVQLAVASLR